MDLLSRIENARTLLAEGRLANEAAVSSGVVLPLLDALGWPVFDPSTVAPEYSVGGRRVDFALLHRGKPVVFVEVKQPGHGVGADRQLFEYAFHEGVPLAVLTDGATWHFYVPALQGSYDERRVYLLDLLERDPEESAQRLTRYLEWSAITSGAALARAHEDYERAKQRRESRAALPTAWAALVGGADPRLLEALVSEVESRSGFRPEPEDALGFLAGLQVPDETQPKRLPRTQRARLQSPQVAEPLPDPGSSTLTSAPTLNAHSEEGGWRWKSVFLPEGTELRATHRGRHYEAVIRGGCILYDGQSFRTPSAAGTAVTGTSVNGWIFWSCRKPGQRGWVLLKTLR